VKYHASFPLGMLCSTADYLDDEVTLFRLDVLAASIAKGRMDYAASWLAGHWLSEYVRGRA